MNTYLSYKLKVLSLIAIIFVVFIHANINIPDSTNFLYENSAFLQYFISQGITRTAQFLCSLSFRDIYILYLLMVL